MNKSNELMESSTGTTVGINVVLSGTLKDVNDIVILGRVEGEVISDKNVFIGDSASIKGPVTAQTVTVSGKINGSITATDRLELTPTGKIFGSISTKDLIIQSGATFVGKCEMTNVEDEDAKGQPSKKDKTTVENDQDNKEEKKEETKPSYEVEE